MKDHCLDLSGPWRWTSPAADLRSAEDDQESTSTFHAEFAGAEHLDGRGIANGVP